MPSSNPVSKERPRFQLEQLRMDAEERLGKGAAPKTNGWALGSDALTLLYRLASNPDTASDALKLLHELQVHQVELDLQHGQLKSVEDEIARTLLHYQTYYEFAPVAYLVLSLDGLIIDTNRAGARLFGLDRDDLSDQRVENYLAPAGRAEVVTLLEQLRAGATDASCEAQSARGTAVPNASLRISASVPPHRGIVLMTVTEAG